MVVFSAFSPLPPFLDYAVSPNESGADITRGAQHPSAQN